VTTTEALRTNVTRVDLVATLAPEMVGLAVTPAAVIACLMLLGSSHPYRNVACLAGVFLAVYGTICLAVVAAGRATDTSTDDPSAAHGWVGLVVGILFLVGGVASWLRPPRLPATSVTPRDGSSDPVQLPGWAARLQDPSVKLVLVVGLVLAVLNPNVAILASGLTVVVTRSSGAEELLGVALLLSGSMVDFVLPTLAFAVSGEGGRGRLRGATRWLVVHNHVIGIVVLVAFGFLFVGRGLAQLLG
jgi:threonine/homoserine/homoserine lactone efflux protein